MFALLLLAVGLLIVTWLQWRFKNRKLLAYAEQMPGPPALPVVGNALQFLWEPQGAFKVTLDLLVEYGNMSKFWLGPELNILVNDPDDIKNLLSNPKTSFKGPVYKFMADLLGGGILSGSGPIWKKHRKMASPNFSKQATDGFDQVFNHEVDLLLEKYRAKAGKPFDVYDHIAQTSSYSVCRTLLGLSKEETMNLPYIEPIIVETPFLYDIIYERMTKWWLKIEPIFWLTQSCQKKRKFVEMMKKFTEKILEITKDKLKMKASDISSPEGQSKLSVIDRFVLSNEFTPKELIEETFTMFTVSEEALAKIAAVMLLMMAQHPECQKKLYTEIKSVLGDEIRSITDEDFKQMPYLEMVFKEVLRLFPIGAIIQRSIIEDIVLGSGTLPKGSSLLIPIWFVHRDPRYWNRPDEFDPERFSPENCKLRHPNCYIPFSLGPMDCMGRHFATRLVKLICVKVVRDFELKAVSKYEDMKLTISISVVPMEGFPAILTPRSC